MARTTLTEALAMGINMLNGRDSVHLTVMQVANIAEACRDADKTLGFRYPDYTIEIYLNGRDGWKLSRFPNKAGLLTRIKHAEVLASVAKRELDKKVEDICRDINAKFMAAINAGRDPMTDAEYTKAIDSYREFCNANGLNNQPAA